MPDAPGPGGTGPGRRVGPRGIHPAALRHRRVGRRRQVDADRPPPPRHQAALRRPARGHLDGQPPPRRRGRGPVLRDRRAAGRARAGHHHRRGLSLRGDAAAQVRHRRLPRATSSTRGTWPPGASTADLAVVVVDATAGLREQTRRHCCIAALLGCPPPPGGRQQDGPGRLGRGRLPGRRRRDARPWPERLGIDDGGDRARLGPPRRQRGASASSHTPWYDGPTILGRLGGRPGRRRGRREGAGRRPACPCSGWCAIPAAGAATPAWSAAAPCAPATRSSSSPAGPAQPDRLGRDLRRRRSTRPPSSLSVTVRARRRPRRLARRPHRPGRRAPPRSSREFDATLCWFGERPGRGRRRGSGSSTPPGSPRPSSVSVARPPRRGRSDARAGRRAGPQRHRRGATRRWPRRWPSTPIASTASPAASW